MPHFGLMDESLLTPVEAALLRARLHIRGGCRRLRQGKPADGMAALADAVNYAMRWYILSHPELDGASVNLESDYELSVCLVRAGALDGAPASGLVAFLTLADRVLRDHSIQFDVDRVLEFIEVLMSRLGVMPFDETALPPESQDAF